MKKLVQTVKGFEYVDITPAQAIKEAQAGDREMIRELVSSKGGFAALTQQQKEAVTQLLLGIPVTL